MRQSVDGTASSIDWGFLGPIEICQALRHLGFHTSPDEILDWLEALVEIAGVDFSHWDEW